MSNSRSIAAVTRTLRYLLDERFKQSADQNVTVTTKPLDKARDGNNNGGDQVNLFLYHYNENAAWRNMAIPSQVRPGETGLPPLPLNLHYLVTVYAQNDDFPDPTSHYLLGEAMGALRDHAILTPEEIKLALPAAELGKHDLYTQTEKVKLTLRSLSEDELNKVWTIFQVPFRFTFVCEASVVLLESGRASRAPLPVLFRGDQSDRGVDVGPGLIPAVPSLSRLELPPGKANAPSQSAARPGDIVTIEGHHLERGTPRLLLQHPLLPSPQVISSFLSQSATALRFSLPNNPGAWRPGFYTLSAELIENAGLPNQRITRTNGLPLPLAPGLTGAITASRVAANPEVVVLTLPCAPQVAAEQRVSLLLTVLAEQLLPGGDPDLEVSLAQLSDRELLAEPRQTSSGSLLFRLDRSCLERVGLASDAFVDRRIQAGQYQIRPRLRVDGIESFVIKDYGAKPLAFIDAQTLVIP